MANETNIVNPPSQEQMAKLEIDESALGRKGTVYFKNKVLSEQLQTAMYDTGKPYCHRCAMSDMQKYQEEVMRQAGAAKRYGSEKNVPYKIPFERYADPSRFRLKKETVKKEEHRVDGHRVTYATVFKDYECLVGVDGKKCGISIQQKELPAKKEK